MPGGRPTKYKPEMLEVIEEHFRQGASQEELYLELNIGHDTWNRWMKTNPEFQEAVKKSKEYSRAWWLREGRKALRDKDFSYTGWYMNMKNRFGWKDKSEVNQTIHLPKPLLDVLEDASDQEDSEA